MTLRFKSKQRGLSFFGIMFVGGFLAVAGVIMAQVVPTVMEYQTISKVVTKASEGTTVAEVHTIFNKAASVDNITSIAGKDLEISKDGDKVTVAFSYQREIHLVGPAFLTLKYSGQSK